MTAPIRSADWIEAAACVGMDPGDFVVIDANGDPMPRHRIEAARRICDRCEVQDRCLDGDYPGDLSMRAGLTPKERRSRIRCGTPAGYRAHRKVPEPPCFGCMAAWAQRPRPERNAS